MLRADDLSVRLNDQDVLRSITLEVAAGEIVAVLGASGSGKSTLLRALCGLTPLVSGSVSWGGASLTTVPTHRRGIGLMFQDHVLFPHLDVAHNVAYGIVADGETMARGTRQGRKLAAEVQARANQLLELVGLPAFGARAIDTLSGGEQQRVALARALAPSPRALLLDEPFGALDRARREELVGEVSQIVRGLNIATIVVTHDHDEAFTMADRVAVLDTNTIVQQGTPAQVWAMPASIAVCALLGFGVSELATFDDDRVVCTWGTIARVSSRQPEGAPRSGRCRIVLRPDACRSEDDGAFVARVDRVLPRGDALRAILTIDGGPECSLVVGPTTRPGDRVRLAINPDAVLLYPV